MSQIKRLLLPVLLAFTLDLQASDGEMAKTVISSEGNSYSTRLKDGSQAVSLWFKAEEPGTLNLRFKADTPTNSIKASVNGGNWEKLRSAEADEANLGKITINKPQYVRLDFKNLGSKFEIIVEGKKEIIASLKFVRNFSTYWGRRGPSVHMHYPLPEIDIEYFYNEVFVPKGNDIVGSYFMANGFGEGYCGIQANSESERRILFSVWSPFPTDDPNKIPEDSKVRLLANGNGVHVGEFGNEGSGGQSFLRYNWKAGLAYKFITRVRPDGNGNTSYTAWFYDYDKKTWRLIASFLRPKTDTWYKGAHSFLENLSPEHGWITRQVFFQNQRARTAGGKWIELTEGGFTHDATAAAGVRRDHAGGAEGKRFFLKNCGFFNESVKNRTLFKRDSENVTFDFDPATLPEK